MTLVDRTVEAWRNELLAHRRGKDQAFRKRGSPLPLHEQASFGGLAYYPPDPAYRLETDLIPGEGGSITVQRTGGDEAVYERAGTLQLRFPPGEVTLAAYRTGNEEGGELFVPFRDATSGTETYAAARYLEVEPTQTGRYLVDFNRAYHPFCAYNDDFSCPLPPRENWLKVPVRAGERLPL